MLLADWDRWGCFLSLCGSRMSRYLDTMRTEMKYTTARARNCACLLSSWNKQHTLKRSACVSVRKPSHLCYFTVLCVHEHNVADGHLTISLKTTARRRLMSMS